MTRDVRKTVCFAVCIAILLAALGILAWATKGFRNWNAEEWFNYWGKGKPSVAEPDKPSVDSGIDKTKDGAIITDGESKGIQLLSVKLPVAAYAANGISEHADTAYVITATIQPSETTNKAVDWTVNWKDAASEWATGKTVTDYVTVTATSDGALSASVECKQAFGEQIIITCTSRENSDISATCTVDYTEKLINAEWGRGYFYGGPYDMFTENGVLNLFAVGSSASGSDDECTGYAIFNIEKTVGTISDTYTCNVEITPTDEFMAALSVGTAGKLSWSFENTVTDFSGRVYYFTYADQETLFGYGIPRSITYYNALGLDSIKNTYGCMLAKITFTGEYSSYTYIARATIKPSSVAVSAQSVTLDNISLVF